MTEWNDTGPQVPLGTMLGGKYRLEAVLGRGGFGTVYRATQLDLNRHVAVKVLHGPIDPSTLARFQREARATGGLGHPHIVQVTDFSAQDPPYSVMEYLPGRSLGELLDEEGRVAPPRAVRITLQILSALAAAHRIGIVHRDIKPANIFLVTTATGDDFVKVLDFGIAKDMAGSGTHGTQSGAILGTVGYMAPEQALGLGVDSRADIYAVGCVMYRMLTGHSAIPVTSVGELLRALAHGTITPPEQHVPTLPPSLLAVVMRALAHDPEARFPDADAMAYALTSAGADHSAPAFAPTMMQAHVSGIPARISTLSSAPTIAQAPPMPSTMQGAARVAPKAAPRSHAGAVIGVGSVLLVLTSAGGYVGFTKYRDGHHASDGATTANAMPSSPAAPATLDAGPNPIAPPPTVSASASKAAPPPATPRPAPSAPASAPVSPANGGVPDPKGTCMCHGTLGHALCPKKVEKPSCSCVGDSILCVDVQSAGPNMACFSTSTTNGTPGGQCTGTRMVGGKPTGAMVNGRFVCDQCGLASRQYRGTTGQACSGIDETSGAVSNGTLKCK